MCCTEKLSALESEVGVRPTQAMLEDMGRAVNEGVKSLEHDIFKVHFTHRHMHEDFWNACLVQWETKLWSGISDVARQLAVC